MSDTANQKASIPSITGKIELGHRQGFMVDDEVGFEE
jgi:hypothetical protein